MTKSELIERQFQDLLAFGNRVLTTKRPPPPNVIGGFRVDTSDSQEWATRTSQLLANLYGRESEYYERFKRAFQTAGYHSDMTEGMAVLKAAWYDYSNGFLFNTKSLIEAEIFDDLLEQSEQLLNAGYYQPAAVLAGAVLEDSLRKLCAKHRVTLPNRPKLDQMNADLAKSGLYNTLVQKRITWLADIRNKAAHGLWSDFTCEDAATMLAQVRSFITDYGV